MLPALSSGKLCFQRAPGLCSEAASAVMIAFLECVGNLLTTPGLALREPWSERGRKTSSKTERETTAGLAECTSLEGRITRPIPGMRSPFILGPASLAMCSEATGLASWGGGGTLIILAVTFLQQV